MKIATNDGFLIDLDAPVIAAYEVRYMRTTRWFVWCTECRDWHTHGPGEGHREAHCCEPTSKYSSTGYNLALAGIMSRTQLTLERARRLAELAE